MSSILLLTFIICRKFIEKNKKIRGLDERVKTEHFSQGDETITLGIVFELSEEQNMLVPEKTIRDTFTTSWNTLFAKVAPLLIDESIDYKLKIANLNN